MIERKLAYVVVKDRKAFDSAIWNTETDFSIEEYNAWLHTAIENLKGIYAMDEVENSPELQYGLGDVINFLNTIEFKEA